MKDLPLRRGQLVTTFGPGSLVISPEGETAMVGALDKWYINDQGNRIDINQYELQEPRLKTLLKVQRLLAPPDYRAGYKMKNVSSAMKHENTDIFIPLLRFPQWHYCPNCRTMHKKGLSERTNRYYCRKCEKEVNRHRPILFLFLNAYYPSPLPTYHTLPASTVHSHRLTAPHDWPNRYLNHSRYKR